MEPIDLKQPDPYYVTQYERVRKQWEESSGELRIRLTEALSVIKHQMYCPKKHSQKALHALDMICTDPLLEEVAR